MNIGSFRSSQTLHPPKHNSALDAEAPFASLVKSTFIGDGPVTAAVLAWSIIIVLVLVLVLVLEPGPDDFAGF